MVAGTDHDDGAEGSRNVVAAHTEVGGVAVHGGAAVGCDDVEEAHDDVEEIHDGAVGVHGGAVGVHGGAAAAVQGGATADCDDALQFANNLSSISSNSVPQKLFCSTEFRLARCRSFILCQMLVFFIVYR